MIFGADNPNQAFRHLRSQGATLPRDPVAGRLAASRMASRGGESWQAGMQESYARLGPSLGRQSLGGGRFSDLNREFLARGGNTDDIQKMHRQRQGSTGMSRGFGTDAALAWPNMRDPFQKFRERAWWLEDFEDFGKALERVRDYCRLVYLSHSLLPALIDIYSRFPLLDIEFKHKDARIVEFYEDLLMNELNYQEHLFDMGREFWTVGEVFSLGSWHDGIGAWDADEVINPDDVEVAKNRMLRAFQFHIKVPQSIRDLVESREPREEYEVLTKLYPHVVGWAREDKQIPVSDILLKHQKFKVNSWFERGVPILMRAFRTLMLEEDLLAAQEGVAQRLYSPLIVAKLGLDGIDEEGPWVPEPEELSALRDDISLALMSDFRLIVYHHGLDVNIPFHRESFPRLDADFDRIDKALMRVFGIGEEMLSGGKSGATYASGALNRELVTQMLQTHQVNTKRFLRERMEVVAEAQEHYEYESKGSYRVPVMERVLMVNEETGEEYIDERPKLAIPEISFRTMNLRDESVERDFLMALEGMGLPISAKSKLMNIPVEFDEELEQKQVEKLKVTVADLEFKKKLFRRLLMSMETGDPLPVPAEYAAEYQAWLAGMQGIASPVPGADVSDPAAAPNMTENSLMEVPMGPAPGGGEEEGPDADTRPEESDEMRAGMPMAAKRRTKQAASSEEELDMRVAHGELDFSSPVHMKSRRKMRLKKGQKVFVDPESNGHQERDEVRSAAFEIEEPLMLGVDGEQDEGSPSE